MLERPKPNEAAPYYSIYIDRVASDDILDVLATQLQESVTFLAEISEEQSLHRYAPGKWSMRELLGHVNDTERVFTFRALWFARGFQDPLPSYDQEIRGRVTWMNFARFVQPPFPSSEISRPIPGRAAASPATTR